MTRAAGPAASPAQRTGGSAIARRARRLVFAAAIACALAGGGLLLSAWLEQQDRARGADLFEGRSALQARLNGHAVDLPVSATRCANCHATDGAQAAIAFGGALDAASLTAPRSRRHGPPSRFDAVSLCRLLRTGVDPAEVMVSPTMPRYDLSDQECLQLWKHLSST